MIAPLTPNTQAILLLTAPLIAGRSEGAAELLSLGDYKSLTRILRDKQKQPADLIGPDASQTIELGAALFGRARLEKLLGRGFLLSQAVDRWNTRAIWVVSRADPTYPRRIKAKLKEDAPPILYGCGDIALLDKGGLAVVGSRHVDDELIAYTENVGRRAATAGRGIVSGGAKGIDRAAMSGGLQGGGVVVGVMADSLERAALARDNREPLMDGQLVLISPYDPSAGFNVGHAMQRNKIIYALADAALVVTADFQKGGTWTGAIEQLERLHFVPVFARNGASAGKGNVALLQHGAQRWPEPQTGEELNRTLSDATHVFSAQPKQDTLQWVVGEDSPLIKATAAAQTPEPEIPAEPVAAPVIESKSAPAETLLTSVRQILKQELINGATDDEVAALLSITKPQAKAWLTQLAGEGLLDKIKKSKPARYRTASVSDRLL